MTDPERLADLAAAIAGIEPLQCGVLSTAACGQIDWPWQPDNRLPQATHDLEILSPTASAVALRVDDGRLCSRCDWKCPRRLARALGLSMNFPCGLVHPGPVAALHATRLSTRSPVGLTLMPWWFGAAGGVISTIRSKDHAPSRAIGGGALAHGGGGIETCRALWGPSTTPRPSLRSATSAGTRSAKLSCR
jgi:hypothetical protein